MPSPPFLIVTDPGPDPDDVKALLIAGTLHRLGRISLVGVIANGGQQPAERAALARVVLDNAGAEDVPVGIGSAGVPYVAQPHEYALAGVADVDKALLVDGGSLFARVLRAAAPRSLRVVLISSLRDFADQIAAEPELVVSRVHTVAIQGGIEPDEAAPSGWRPDTSVNNGFDMAAATAVYAFCLAHGVRMTITQRDAVPPLPMQLARSFAERTDSPLLRYLAGAQHLGLQGLWIKLCEGRLPARCSKQWYFETFCGESADEFASHGREQLGVDSDVSPFLNGYVKPYDVVALMTVLPHTAPLFTMVGALAPIHPAGGFGAERYPRFSTTSSATSSKTPFNSTKMPRRTTLVAPLDPIAGSSTPQPSPERGRSALRKASSTGAIGAEADDDLGAISSPLAIVRRRSRVGDELYADSHLLLLKLEHAVDVSHVQDILRDCYHEVLLLYDAHHSGVRPVQIARARSRSRRVLPSAARVHFDAEAAARAAPAEGAADAPAPRTYADLRLRGAFGAHVGHVGFGAVRTRRLLADLASAPADAVASGHRASAAPAELMDEKELAAKLRVSILSVRLRLLVVSSAGLVLGLALLVVAVAGQLSRLAKLEALRDARDAVTAAHWAARADEAAAARAVAAGLDGEQAELELVFSTIGIMGLVLISASLQPMTSFPRVMVGWCALLCASCVTIGAIVHVVELAGALADAAMVARLAATEPLSAIERVILSALRVLEWGLIWAVGATQLWRARRSAQAQVGIVLSLVGLTCLAHALVGGGQFGFERSARAPTTRPSWFAPLLASITATSLALSMLVLAPVARERGRLALARCTKRIGLLDGAGPAAALAPLLGHGAGQRERDAHALVSAAFAAFAPIEISGPELRRLGRRLFGSETERARARARSTLSRRSGLLGSALAPRRSMENTSAVERTIDRKTGAGAADAYVVHSGSDDAAAKLEALAAWADAFEARARRPPVIWIDVLCADPSLTQLEQLEYMPVFLGRCRTLLLLAGESVTEQLRPMVELYAWRVLGGPLASIDVAIAVRPGVSLAVATAAPVSAIDSFHVMYCGLSQPKRIGGGGSRFVEQTVDGSPEKPAHLRVQAEPTDGADGVAISAERLVQARLLLAVEVAGVSHFNSAIRACCGAVRGAALELQSEATTSAGAGFF